MVNEAIAVKARDAAEEAKGVALETMHDVRDKMMELRNETPKRRRERQRRRRSSFGLLVLAAVGLTVVVMVMKRRREAYEYGPSSDAFGAAVVEEQRAADSGRPVATPGA